MRYLLITNNKERARFDSLKEAKKAIEKAQKDGAEAIHLRGYQGYIYGDGGCIYKEINGATLLDVIDKIPE